MSSINRHLLQVYSVPASRFWGLWGEQNAHSHRQGFVFELHEGAVLPYVHMVPLFFPLFLAELYSAFKHMLIYHCFLLKLLLMFPHQ